MERQEIIAIARSIVEAGRPFVLATVDASGAPRVRWMGGLVLEPPLTLYMPAGVASRKMTQIRNSPLAQLLLNSEDLSRVVTLDGECQIVEDPEARRRVWDALPSLGGYYAGPADPTFGVIRFEPRRIELLMAREHGQVPLVAEL